MEPFKRKGSVFQGTDIELLALMADYLTSKAFQSLHRLLFHSSFMGDIPSVLDVAREDVTSIIDNSYSKKCSIISLEVLAMLPIINVAAKGLLTVVSNIGYSIGKNIYKATLGKKDSDELIFERYL